MFSFNRLRRAVAASADQSGFIGDWSATTNKMSGFLLVGKRQPPYHAADHVRACVNLLFGPGRKAEKQALIGNLSGEMTRQRPRCHSRLCQLLCKIDITVSWVELNDKLHASRWRRNLQGMTRGRTERLDQPVTPATIDTGHLADMCREMTVLNEFSQGIQVRGRLSPETLRLAATAQLAK